MTKKEELIEFLKSNKKDVDYWDENANYDPNPYWLAGEIEKLFTIPVVVKSVSPDEKKKTATLKIQLKDGGYKSNETCKISIDQYKRIQKILSEAD